MGYPGTSSYLYLNGLRVHYLSWNAENGKQPALLLHGLASNARIWEKTAPRLAERGFAVYAPDLRGHGLTDKPDEGYSFDAYYLDVAALCTTLELEHPLLVGHSWGAMLAVDLAARLSIGPRAPARLALVDGGLTQLDASGQTREEMRQRLTPPSLAGTPVEVFLERLRHYNPRWQPDEHSVQIILANFEIGEDETIAPRLSFEHHMQIVDAMWEFKTYEKLRRVRCPVLALPARPSQPLAPGEADYLAYKEAGAIQAQKALPGLRVRWMEDSIHDIPLQRPAELAQQVADFMAE